MEKRIMSMSILYRVAIAASWNFYLHDGLLEWIRPIRNRLSTS